MDLSLEKISLRDIDFFYRKKKVLSQINLECVPGKIYALVGPNGSGKSTLLKVLSGTLLPSQGEVITHKQYLAYLCDEVHLYPEMTVAENLNFALSLRPNFSQKRAEEIVAVKDDLAGEDFFNQKVFTLSKGQKQRAALAQIFLTSPQWLLLDEPLLGLDPQRREELVEKLTGFAKKGGVVISSHLLHDVEEFADYFIFLQKGELLFVEEKEHIRNKFGSLKKCYQHFSQK